MPLARSGCLILGGCPWGGLFDFGVETLFGRPVVILSTVSIKYTNGKTSFMSASIMEWKIIKLVCLHGPRFLARWVVEMNYC